MAFCILEGGDGTGKSTLAVNIALALEAATPQSDTMLLHSSQPQGDVLDEYITNLADYQPGSDVNIVADRWHLGELIYAPLYRGTGPYGALGKAGFRWVEMWLRSRGVVMWLVDQPFDVVQQRLKTRGEDFLEERHVAGVLDNFKLVNLMSSISAGVVQPPNGDQQAYAQALAAHVLYEEHQASWINNYPGYIGSPKPKAILVGDGMFDPKPTAAGSYLLEALPVTWWPDIAIVPTTVNFDALVSEFTNLPQFVAMSRDASDVLLDVDMIHAGAVHPEDVRHSVSTQQDYGRMVQNVAETGRVNFSWQNS